MEKIATGSRYFLGLVFAVFGFNYFVPFIPHPEITGDALVYMTGLTKAGYFWPLLRSLELIFGIALLSNRFVPLALTILGPITLHIFLFHAFLMPANLVLAIIMLIAHGLLIKANWNIFKNLLTVKTEEEKSEVALTTYTA
jgi:putative oxidoreductase